MILEPIWVLEWRLTFANLSISYLHLSFDICSFGATACQQHTWNHFTTSSIFQDVSIPRVDFTDQEAKPYGSLWPTVNSVGRCQKSIMSDSPSLEWANGISNQQFSPNHSWVIDSPFPLSRACWYMWWTGACCDNGPIHTSVTAFRIMFSGGPN